MKVTVGKKYVAHIIGPYSMIEKHLVCVFSGQLPQVKWLIHHKMMDRVCFPEIEAKPLHWKAPPWVKYLNLLNYISMFYVSVVVQVG